MDYAQTLTVVALIVVNLFSCLNFTRNSCSVVGHILTQDSHAFPLTVDYKTGPYIDQMGVNTQGLKFSFVLQNVNDYSLLTICTKYTSRYISL